MFDIALVPKNGVNQLALISNVHIGALLIWLSLTFLADLSMYSHSLHSTPYFQGRERRMANLVSLLRTFLMSSFLFGLTNLRDSQGQSPLLAN